MTGGFGMAQIVPPKTFREVLARPHIAATSLTASQNVNVKHNDKTSDPLGPAGFEPATS